jgi:GT2 family glycosyltransferase
MNEKAMPIPVKHKCSYIMSTRNRAAGLDRCLSYVSKISFSDWELIVVDNGSTDFTADVIKKHQQIMLCPLIFVRENCPGLSNGRNAGIKASSGDILVFSDDDCYPDKDFLTKIDEAFENEKHIGYISGRIELYDPTDAPVTIKTSARPKYFRPRSYIGSGKVIGANMAFRRDVIAKIGLFDSRFGAGTSLPGAEEQDLSLRASLVGYSGKYCPEIVTFHHHGRKESDINALHRGYNIGRGGWNTKLLLSRDTFIYGLIGWASLVKRVFFFQSSFLDELIGAVRFLTVSRNQELN